MSEESSKVYMVPDCRCGAETMAMMNNNNNWMNNPFMYLIWLAFFGGNGFGFGNRGLENSGQIAQLQDTVNTNHNNDLAMQAIQGNGTAIHELACSLNVSSNSLNAAINDVRSAIQAVGAQSGIGQERVINSILLGNKDLIQQLASCCCENKQLITTMGYEGQLRDQSNTCAITTRIGELANGVQTGFANIGYNQQTIKSEILQNNNANTQRIIDTMNNHWQSELQQKYYDAKLELSQKAQNEYLVAQLKTS